MMLDAVQTYLAQGDYVSALIGLVAYLLTQVAHKGVRKAKASRAPKPVGLHAPAGPVEGEVQDGEVDPTDGE